MPIGVYNQLCTYWQQLAMDTYGKRGFTTPIAIYVRWQDVQEVKLSKDGEARPCAGVIWAQQDMSAGDYLSLGDQTATADPTTLDTAFEIFAFSKEPSVRAEAYLRKAFLTPK